MTQNSTDPRPGGLTRRPYPIKARVLTVVRTEDLSEDMRRIVLTGDDLEPTLPFLRLAPSDHIKLLLPDEATGEIVLPTFGERGAKRPEGAVLRDYTIRAFDAEARELTLDFVLHDHGPAGRWAIAAGLGSRVGVLGPRGSTIFPDTFARYVVGADETALPATERWIEEAPEGATLDAFVLVEDLARERTLPTHPGLTLRWLHRSAGDDLAAAVAAAVPSDDGDTFVWVSAEATSLVPLRRHLRDVGLDHDRTSLHGYWKAGVAGHHDPRGGGDGAGPGAGRGPEAGRD